jgi:Circularly permutated YpsA SLOG family
MTAPPPDPSSWQQPSLRARIARAQAGRCVLTGGQTGVDTLAAQSALRTGLAVHLVFPLGFRQEDGPLTAARRAELPGATLHELARPDFRLRTWTCAYLSDAVILLDPAGGDGCRETLIAASHLGRPLLDLTPGAESFRVKNLRGLNHLPELIMQWATDNQVRVLMIAGCRASLLAAHGQTAGLSGILDEITAGLAAPG